LEFGPAHSRAYPLNNKITFQLSNYADDHDNGPTESEAEGVYELQIFGTGSAGDNSQPKSGFQARRESPELDNR